MENGFAGWFPHLPAALNVGVEWTDTTKAESDFAAFANLKTKTTEILHYRVARDSTVGDLRVLVIDVAGTSDSTGSGGDGGDVIAFTFKGETSGRMLYAPTR